MNLSASFRQIDPAIAFSISGRSPFLSRASPRSKPGIKPKGDALKRLAIAAPKLNAAMIRHVLYNTDCSPVGNAPMITSAVEAREYAANAEPRVRSENAVNSAR